MTEQERKLQAIKNDPANLEALKGKTDEEILAAYRFVEDGENLDVYDSEEAYRAAMKKRQNIEEIEEV